jgi:hypothetical protein
MKFLHLYLGILAAAGEFFISFFLVATSIPGRDISSSLSRFLDISLYGLCGIAILAGVLMVCGFFLKWEHVYSWLLAPIPFIILFLILRLTLPFN